MRITHKQRSGKYTVEYTCHFMKNICYYILIKLAFRRRDIPVVWLTYIQSIHINYVRRVIA